MNIIQIVILHDSLSEDKISFLKNNLEKVIFVNINKDNYKAINIKAVYSNYLISAYYKLDLFNLPKKLGDILYIDIDTITINKIPKLKCKSIGMVKEYYGGFNSGLIYIPKSIRNSNTYNGLLKLISENNKYADQDVINKFFNNNVIELPQELNFPSGNNEFNNATILHFYGTRKPWHINESYSTAEILWHKFNEEAKEYYGLK